MNKIFIKQSSFSDWLSIINEENKNSICQLDKKHKLIKIYPNIFKVTQDFPYIRKKDIQKCCEGKISFAGNYIWQKGGKFSEKDFNHMKTYIEIYQYYDNLVNQTYEDAVQILIQKYGQPKESYFCRPTCASPNPRIKRTAEGLFIHHIREDQYIALSNKAFALKAPYEFQEGNNLVYCNYYEHLILHLILTNKFYINSNHEIIGFGGVQLITKEILTYNENTTQKWRKICHKCIEEAPFLINFLQYKITFYLDILHLLPDQFVEKYHPFFTFE